MTKEEYRNLKLGDEIICTESSVYFTKGKYYFVESFTEEDRREKWIPALDDDGDLNGIQYVYCDVVPPKPEPAPYRTRFSKKRGSMSRENYLSLKPGDKVQLFEGDIRTHLTPGKTYTVQFEDSTNTLEEMQEDVDRRRESMMWIPIINDIGVAVSWSTEVLEKVTTPPSQKLVTRFSKTGMTREKYLQLKPGDKVRATQNAVTAADSPTGYCVSEGKEYVVAEDIIWEQGYINRTGTDIIYIPIINDIGSISGIHISVMETVPPPHQKLVTRFSQETTKDIDGNPLKVGDKVKLVNTTNFVSEPIVWVPAEGKPFFNKDDEYTITEVNPPIQYGEDNIAVKGSRIYLRAERFRKVEIVPYRTRF